MLENVGNAITRLPMYRFGRNLGGHIHHVPDMSAMMRLPWQRPLPSNDALYIQQLWASGDRRVNQFWWNLVNKHKLGPQWQSRDQILIFFNSKWRTAAMLENIHNVITRLSMDPLRPNLGGHITSCPRHVAHDSVATAVARQWRIEHSAVMDVWRPNAWTNFDKIWYTTQNYDLNDGHLPLLTFCHVIKY